MVRFSDFDDFAPIAPRSRTYAQGSATSWDIGRKGSGYVLDLEAVRTFDISVPRWLRPALVLFLVVLSISFFVLSLDVPVVSAVLRMSLAMGAAAGAFFIFKTELLSPHNRAVLMAARVHDELLEEGFDQAFASSEFRRALRARGLSSLYAWLLFFATLFATAFKKY